MENIIPISERVLIKPLKAEKKTKSGIIIPENAKEKPQEGIILSVGKEVKHTILKVGEKVLFKKYSGTKINYKKKKYLIIHTTDILAIIKE
ncbi:co-chaperone GroES [Candidatus Karelsulcia muelleri]|uniref:co-chaperone GroES n=1 Tax=Candidatus Karelsulcia muelleri TaxID=336810 RepID=UPI002363CD1B|nr:co-chaperone GroES [Candidatus Karelsulcia muelleri]WDE42225.1 co-chaperone GroES [Candidatus Karelsulcia muelleri]WDR79072.1 co-chaperone GroES [Candidatus Karelsulcia muelleri]